MFTRCARNKLLYSSKTLWEVLTILDILISLSVAFIIFLTIQNIFITGFSLISFIHTTLHYIKRKTGRDIIRKMGKDLSFPPISVLVPAHNEEFTIIESVKSLLKVNYDKFEVIVINDGSSDNTLERLIQDFCLERSEYGLTSSLRCKPIISVYKSNLYPNLIVIDKVKGGKADALNCGINISQYDLYTCLDADTILEKDAIRKIVYPFIKKPNEVVAAGGTIKVINGCGVNNGNIAQMKTPSNLVVLMQIIEYIKRYNILRTSWGALNGLLVLSGAFGVFKKSTVIEVGGYSKSTVSEDTELIIKIHDHFSKRRDKYRIVHVPEACAWTQVPENMSEVKRQRIRWRKGKLGCLVSFKHMLFNYKYGCAGLITVPFTYLTDIIAPFITPFGYAVVIISLLLNLLDHNAVNLFIYGGLILGMIPSLVGILIEKIFVNRYRGRFDLVKILGVSIIEHFVFTLMTSIWTIKAAVEYLSDNQTWAMSERKSFNQLS